MIGLMGTDTSSTFVLNTSDRISCSKCTNCECRIALPRFNKS